MKTNFETTVNQAFHTADAAERCAAADVAFAIDFVNLSPERQAGCWRGLTHAEKSRLVVRRIETLGKDWTPSVVEQFIAKYDERFRAGPVDAAVEGALERLAFDNAQRAETADKADHAFFRRAATAYSNALDQYRKGVRPERLQSGTQLVPSSQPGKPAHIVRLVDGDFVCSCKAGASMHWPIALLVGIETAHDDMTTHDDGPDGEADRAHAVLAARLDATAAIIAAMRAAQASEPACVPPGTPIGDDLPDDVPPSARQLGYRLAQARANSSWYAVAA